MDTGLGIVVVLSATRVVGRLLMRRWWGTLDFEPSWCLAGASWDALGWRREGLGRRTGGAGLVSN